MSAAWYVGRSTVRHRWRAIVALAVFAGLVGGVVLASVAGARRTASSYDRFREDTNADDAFVQASGIDPALVRQAFDHPTVRDWTGASMYVGDPGSDYDFGLLASGDGRFGTTISRARVLEGRLPDPDAAEEIVVNERTADVLGIGVGDELRMKTLSPEQLADIEESFDGRYRGPTVPLTVVGLIRAPDDLQGTTSFGFGGVGTPAFERRYAREAGHYDGFYAVDLERGRDDLAAFREHVTATLPATQEWGTESADEAAGPVRDALRVLAVGLVLFAAVAGVAGAVAVTQALSRQLGLDGDAAVRLAAMGLGRRERAVAVLVPGAVVAAGAGLTALVVAVAASPLFPIGLGGRAEPDPGVDVDVTVLALGAVGVVAVALLRVAAAAWSSSRVDDVRARSRTSVVAGALAQAGAGPALVTGARMALEPGRGRSRVPVRPALVGAAAGALGVAAAVTFAASLDRLVDTPTRWGWNWDLAPDAFPGDLERFAAEPDVGDVGNLDFGFVRIEGIGTGGYALEEVKGSPSLTLLEGRAPATADEVALGPDVLGELDRRVGDTVDLDRAFGGDGGPVRLRVVGTALFPTFETETLASGALLTPEGLQAVRQSEGFERALLGFEAGVDEAAAADRLEREYPENFSVYAVPELPGDIANLAQVDLLPWVLAGFLAVLALAAAGHALTVAVRRRRGELGVLRALGFSRGQARRVVAWQATTYAVGGVLVGLPLGIAAGRWAWALVADAVGVLDDPAVPGAVLLAVPIGSLVLTNLAGVLPARRAAALAPADALRSE